MKSLIKGNFVTLTIEDIGTDGEGIGKCDGYTLFVKDAIIGDTVRAKVIKTKKNYGYGRLEEVISPSEERVTPVCPVARQCGGCQIQQMSYDAQLKFKEKLVHDNLVRIGGLDLSGVECNPCMGMDDPFHYRNKAQYPVGMDRDGNTVIGFYAGRTHSIIPCTDCAIGARENVAILAIIKSWMEMNSISAYDENSKRGLVRHILIRTGYRTDEIMVCLVVNAEKMSKHLAESLVNRLTQVSLDSDCSSQKKIVSVMVNYNQDDTNVILGRRCDTLWGKSYIEDYIGDVKFQISPLSFFQVNPVQTEKLYKKALEYADLKGNEVVWDLYCGIGTISLFLAKNAKRVFGVEIVPQAIEDAKNNARINNIDNAEFYVGKAEEVVPDLCKREGDRVRPDVVVVDPPRKGCDETLLDTIVAMSPERIVYVSCDSATLARDLKVLTAKGYELKKVQPVDQFGHTVHVETVCLLSKLHEAKHHVSVKLDMDEMDLTSAESKATYEEIKAYVLENSGLQVSSLYIAQVKREYGIIERENYKDSKQPQCPDEKKKAIKEALIHFGMI